MSNSGRGFAAETKVPVDQTRAEIERTLKRYGADRFAYFSEAERVIILFEANERRKFLTPDEKRAAMYGLPRAIGTGEQREA